MDFSASGSWAGRPTAPAPAVVLLVDAIDAGNSLGAVKGRSSTCDGTSGTFGAKIEEDENWIPP